jgi:hypothetical protein
MTSTITIFFSGSQQKTPADQGDWKIFINEKLIKSSFWPKTIAHTCNDEKNAYMIRSNEFYYMNDSDITVLSELLTANGFESVGNFAKPAFRPRTNDVPRYVMDPNAKPFDYSTDEGETKI